MSEKRERTVVYRCRLCEAVSGNITGHMTYETAQDRMQEVLDWGCKKVGDVTIRKFQFHKCEDGSLGVADLVGVVNTRDADGTR